MSSVSIRICELDAPGWSLLSSTSSSLGNGKVSESLPTVLLAQMAAVGDEEDDEIKLIVEFMFPPQLREIGFGDGVVVSKDEPRLRFGEIEVDTSRLGLNSEADCAKTGVGFGVG